MYSTPNTSLMTEDREKLILRHFHNWHSLQSKFHTATQFGAVGSKLDSYDFKLRKLVFNAYSKS